MIDIFKNWMEYLLVAFIIIGMVIALVAPSAVISYIIILISGIFAGKILQKRKNAIQLPFVTIIIGFLVGYAIATNYGSRRVIIVLFILGSIMGYKLYDKGFLRH